MKLLARLISVGAIATALGCGTTPSGTGSTTPPKFSDIQQIFQSCAVAACHGSATTANGNLDLSAANAYTSLLGADGKGAPIPTSTLPGEVKAKADGYLLVSPGHPEKSFLALKVTSGLDTTKYGAQMPNIGAVLSDTQVKTITDWITEGAPNN